MVLPGFWLNFGPTIFAIARLITALRAGSDKAALLVVYLVAVPPI